MAGRSLAQALVSGGGQLTASSQSRAEEGSNRLNCGATRVVKVLIVEYPRGEQGRLRLDNAE